MHTLTNAREREGRASARAEWPGRPAGPWPAPELELQGAGKRPRPGKATRSRSPPDGMATSPQHPPHGARARGRGGGGSRHAGRCTRGAQSSSRGVTCTGPGGGGTRTRQGLADRGRLKWVPRAIRVRPTGRQQVQSRGPGHSCGHLAAGTTPRWIRGARASTAGRAQPNLPAASAHHTRNGRQQCRP